MKKVSKGWKNIKKSQQSFERLKKKSQQSFENGFVGLTKKVSTNVSQGSKNIFERLKNYN